MNDLDKFSNELENEYIAKEDDYLLNSKLETTNEPLL